jgi:lysine biosynthesis protein LysW
MMYAECPTCGASINVGKKPKMGQRFTCPSCKEVAEVVWLHPVELDWPIDDEDFEDDSEFEDEEEEEFYYYDEEEDDEEDLDE